MLTYYNQLHNDTTRKKDNMLRWVFVSIAVFVAQLYTTPIHLLHEDIRQCAQYYMEIRYGSPSQATKDAFENNDCESKLLQSSQIIKESSQQHLPVTQYKNGHIYTYHYDENSVYIYQSCNGKLRLIHRITQ